MLCTTRERRANAGSKMAVLLENEDADEFYQSAYGGFAEVCYSLITIWSVLNFYLLHYDLLQFLPYHFCFELLHWTLEDIAHLYLTLHLSKILIYWVVSMCCVTTLCVFVKSREHRKVFIVLYVLRWVGYQSCNWAFQKLVWNFNGWSCSWFSWKFVLYAFFGSIFFDVLKLFGFAGRIWYTPKIQKDYCNF